MPFTPYHFGPSGFLGLVFRKWIDVPVFILVNVIVDIEVLVVMVLGLGWPPHRYCHTLLIGAVVGMLSGIVAYPLRSLFKKIMSIFRISYEPSFRKMVISGILGVWLHVVIDGLCHNDLRIFWPNTDWKLALWAMITYILSGNIYQHHLSVKLLKIICIAFFVASFIVYILILQVSKRMSLGTKLEKNDVSPGWSVDRDV